MTRRFFRIFPVYLFFLFLSVLAAPFALDVWTNAPDGFMKATRIAIATSTLDQFWPHLITHVLALQTVVPDSLLPRGGYAFLGQAWSISLEWQFYLIAPFMLNFMSNPSVRKAFLGLAVTFVGIVLSHWIMPNGFIGAHLHEFLIGMLSYELLISDNEFVRKYFSQLLLAVFLTCLFFWTPRVIPYLIWVGAMAVLVRREENSGITTALSRFLKHSCVQNIGHMCYSIYLSHMLVILMGLWGAHKFGLTQNALFPWFLLAFTLVGTLFVSWFSYRLIEKPFHDFGRSVGRGRIP